MSCGKSFVATTIVGLACLSVGVSVCQDFSGKGKTMNDGAVDTGDASAKDGAMGGRGGGGGNQGGGGHGGTGDQTDGGAPDVPSSSDSPVARVDAWVPASFTRSDSLPRYRAAS